MALELELDLVVAHFIECVHADVGSRLRPMHHFDVVSGAVVTAGATVAVVLTTVARRSVVTAGVRSLRGCMIVAIASAEVSVSNLWR